MHSIKKSHSILRTQSYHPELQPIETCLAVVKPYVAAHNDFTMKKVRQLLEEGFEKVTCRTIAGIMKQVRTQEDNYWSEDVSCFDVTNVYKEDNFADFQEG